ncbi:TolB family protein [Kitasatospora sp. NPDC056783]|uniref:TolB family protein n=1 Tax=Kitasatospora sp. NPDC056783 TaxID=3345943 RepID=UPI0036761DF3
MTRTTRTTRNRLLSGGGAVLAAAVALAVAAAPAQADAAPRGTTQVSVGLNGAAPDDQAWSKGLSANGRYALFTSWAQNLVSQPSKSRNDAFVRDLRTGRTERVNLADDGSALDGSTDYVAINGNGRFVAFESDASNVASGAQVPGREELYVRDRKTGRTELISRSLAGATPDTDKYHSSYAPSISADGRWVAFVSSRKDLVPETAEPEPEPSLTRPYTWKYNVYLTDRRTGTTRLVSHDLDGKPGESLSLHPTISADGRTIGFSSLSALLPHEDPQEPAAADVEVAPGADAALPAGQSLTSHPTIAHYYTYDAATGKLSAASLNPDGTFALAGFDATISPDGRRAVYALPEPGGSTGGHHYHLVLHVRDLRTGAVTRVSGGLPGTSSIRSSGNPSITADNRWVYFDSAADNLVPGPQHPGWDVYRQDLRTGRTERVATTPNGSPGNGSSQLPFVDASGDTVLFGSTSTDLLAGAAAPAGDSSQVFAKATGRHQGDGDDQGEDQDD